MKPNCSGLTMATEINHLKWFRRSFKRGVTAKGVETPTSLSDLSASSHGGLCTGIPVGPLRLVPNGDGLTPAVLSDNRGSPCVGSTSCCIIKPPTFHVEGELSYLASYIMSVCVSQGTCCTSGFTPCVCQ